MNTWNRTSSLPARVIPAALAGMLVSALAVSTLGAQSTPASRERHAIRFERPRAVGSRYRIEVSGEKTIRMEQRGAAAPVRDERTVVRMVAVERIVAVNAMGEPTNSEYTVETFEVERGGTRVTALARGTVFLLERATTPDGQARITVGGAPVAADIADALAVVVSRKVSAVSDDEVFGSTNPRRVGERWNINAAVAQRELAANGLTEVRLRGEVRAVELATVDSLPCLVLSANMTGRLGAIPNMPSVATFVSGTIETTHRGAFPTDGTSRPPTTEMTMGLDATFTVNAGAGQPVQTFHMVITDSRNEHATLLP